MPDATSTSPRTAAWRVPVIVLGALWIAALAALLLAGRDEELLSAPATLAGVCLFAWLVVRITRARTPEPALEHEPARPARPARRERARLWAQVAWLSLVIACTGWGGLVFHGIVRVRLPVWDHAVQTMGDLGQRWLSPQWVGGSQNALANPTAYFVLPLLGLLALGARFRSLGFARGHRVIPATALLCALPIAWIAWQAPAPQRLIGALLGNTLQNGPFEEFLFRGALQTRLVPLLGGVWAIGLQALAFGLWHLGMAAHNEPNLWLAAAHTIVAQGTIGVLFGVVMLRTRNLWAGSILHVVANAAAGLS